MSAKEEQRRLDAEWVGVTAIRELMRLATEGDSSKSTYDQALAFGGQLYPELLGPDSLLKKYRESDTAREYRQRAQAKSTLEDREVDPLELISAEILELETLLNTVRNHQKTDRLKKRLAELRRAQAEIDPGRHSEHQAIFRDAYVADRGVPELGIGHGAKDFELPAGDILRVRVLHPDAPEAITGADIVYERHNRAAETVNLVGVQYKIWEEKSLYLNDERMRKQLNRMRAFFCDNNLCRPAASDHAFRFPYCAAFLRPTDRLQSPDQKLMTTGEHLPICQIDQVKTSGIRGAETLKYDDIRYMSLSHEVFEGLFTNGKVGSRTLTYDELRELYRDFGDIVAGDRMLIHAQDFNPVDSAATLSGDPL